MANENAHPQHSATRPNDKFAGPRAHLLRAYHHMRELAEATSAYVQQATDEGRPASDPVTREGLEVRSLREPKLDLAILAFDAVMNLKAAVDQALFIASEIVAPDHVSRDPEGITMPSTAENFEAMQKGKGRSRSVPLALHEMIRPWTAPGRGVPSRLVVLNKLANMQKHRRLVPWLHRAQVHRPISLVSIGSKISFEVEDLGYGEWITARYDPGTQWIEFEIIEVDLRFEKIDEMVQIDPINILNILMEHCNHIVGSLRRKAEDVSAAR